MSETAGTYKTRKPQSDRTRNNPWEMSIERVELAIGCQLPGGWIDAELLGRFLGFFCRQNAPKSLENHLGLGEDYQVALVGSRISQVKVSLSGAKAWGAVTIARRRGMKGDECRRMGAMARKKKGGEVIRSD